MPESKWWPQNAGDLAAYATTFASIATLLLFVIAVRQLRLVRTQVEVSQKEVAAAQASAAAAQDSAEAAFSAAQEAARGRADAGAPRLVVEILSSGEAFADPTRSSRPGGGELRLLDARSVHQSRVVQAGDEFVFDRDANTLIWFRFTGSVRNEGLGSARVRLDGEAQFEDEEHGAEVVLKPSQSLHFAWAAAFTASELAARHDRPQPARDFLIVTGRNFDEHGIIDKIHIEFASRALQRVPGNQAAWAFRDDPTLRGLVVYPTQRVYRWDWEAGRVPPPPWPDNDSED